MKLVTVRVIGGLGNQLHCYAFGRAIAIQNNAKLRLDTESGFWNDPYKREYLLDQFSNLKASYCSYKLDKRVEQLLFKLWVKVMLIWSHLFPLYFRSIIIERIPQRYQQEIHYTNYITNPYFMGYWATYRYYKGIEKELRQELSPPIPTEPSVLDMLSKIQSTHSCFIHWRSYKEEKGVIHPSLYVYYCEAIKIMLKKYSNLSFFVFSDDLIAAKKEIPPISTQITYVDLPAARGNLQSLADFYLMYSCDHAIIGDSTFSWWAAWLSEQEGKTIIAPKGLSPWGEDWLPPNWISLNINKKTNNA